MLSLVLRCLKLILRDRMALLTMLVGLVASVGMSFYLANKFDFSDTGLAHGAFFQQFLLVWLLPTQVTINSLYAAAAVFSHYVRDLENQRLREFFVAPLHTWHIAASYVLVAWVLGFVLSVLSYLTIVFTGGAKFNLHLAAGHWLSLLWIAVDALLGTLTMGLLATIFNSRTAYTWANNLYQLVALIGTGALVPYGFLSERTLRMLAFFPQNSATLGMRVELFSHWVQPEDPAIKGYDLASDFFRIGVAGQNLTLWYIAVVLLEIAVLGMLVWAKIHRERKKL